MEKIKSNSPFTYERGKFKLQGRTDTDRKTMQIDTILHWVWKIIIALTFLIGAIYHFISR